MFAPLRMKMRTVREPNTTSTSAVNGNSFKMSSGSKVPSGSQMHTRSASRVSAMPRWMAEP